MQNLKILDKLEYLSYYEEKYMFIEFPRKYKVLRNRIKNNIELMIEKIIRASINEGRIKNKYYREVIISITIIEYNIRMITNKNIIKSKRIEVFLRRLIEIKKMAYGCINF